MTQRHCLHCLTLFGSGHETRFVSGSTFHAARLVDNVNTAAECHRMKEAVCWNPNHARAHATSPCCALPYPRAILLHPASADRARIDRNNHAGTSLRFDIADDQCAFGKLIVDAASACSSQIGTRSDLQQRCHACTSTPSVAVRRFIVPLNDVRVARTPPSMQSMLWTGDPFSQ
ncbi:hypothetical protein PHSY_005412 [Pseudozyma hubeiensis SY62]|uniref:Uncharacterized protein n=1 Tax=Pseudozyma hubeiensis (strain SY62) TaxID=1305764 RepID=R9P915_PSEHS|nr:hypothetical protein PHSY_005412 [Pseudozyma hubeiensis SY62]GAC97824.1 hypothetical protein PHSY_005412 [Pseudozyma hubeiensis SY62]